MTENTSPSGGNAARTWQTNADDFRDLDQGKGWAFAILVACSVVEGGAAAQGKASISAFAARAGTEHQRIGRYMKAWSKAAEAGVVPAAEQLEPDDAVRMPAPDVPFGKFFDGSRAATRGHGGLSSLQAVIEQKGADAVLKALPKAQVHALTEAAVKHADFQQLQDIKNTATEKIAEKMPEINAFNAKHRAEKDAEHAKSGSFWRWSSVIALISGARDKVRDALHSVQLNSVFTDDERETIVADLGKLEAACGLLRLALTGSVEIDWDAEFEKMGEKE